MTNKPEALFQEHWRRFFLSPQADSAAVRRISGALYWNDQLLWSLGIIPWGAWRLPFQASILRFLHEALPRDAVRLYAAIHTALATAQGNFLSPPSEADKQSLIQRVEQFCEGEAAAHLVRQIQSITPKQPFFRNAALESMLRCISVKYREKLRQRENAYYACLFHFRVLQAFLERLEPLLSEESQAIRNSVTLLSWQALFDAAPEPIQLFPEKRITADLRHISGEIYNFWSWQYTCRNEEYQKLRAVLEPFLHGSGSISITPCVPVSNLKEYQTITGRLETGDGLGQELFAACNQAIDAMVEKFGYFPAWPIVDYTSDFILGRILSGQFRYWERENPPPKIGHENNFQLCPRDATQCTLEGRKTQTAATVNVSSPSAPLTVLPLSSRRNNACSAQPSTRNAAGFGPSLCTGCSASGSGIIAGNTPALRPKPCAPWRNATFRKPIPTGSPWSAARAKILIGTTFGSSQLPGPPFMPTIRTPAAVSRPQNSSHGCAA